ncbi:MAG: glycoside hydrolase family 25 protein, partial [Eubacterium sp.]|nr:glycoside hydrolase family 25 protein [Eubacterium sp.]
LNLDPSFEINLKGAKKAGLEVGVYFFSQAVNEKEAVEEAEYVLKHLDGEKLDLEVVFDPEDVPDTSARTRNVTGAQFTRNAIAFCETIREAGYEPAVYGNLKWMTSVLDMAKLSDYPVWYAQYSLKPQSPYTFRYWQYSSTGHVPGVEGDVDLNIELIPCDGESEE